PGPGASGGALQPELLNKLGVSLIFFLHGLLLPFAALKNGALQWRLHSIVQASTYLLFPLLTLGLLFLVGDQIPPDLRLGFLFLGALPSTVSSSVAMTAAARGNVPAAVFNATLSNLIGVVLTPLWISLLAEVNGQAMPLGKVIADLCLWLVLPLAIGQLMRPWLGAWAAAHKKQINRVDRGTILLLVYTSFCDSIQQRVWTDHGTLAVTAAAIGASLLFFVVLLILWRGADALGFVPADRAALVFCGTKKTLASGVPMARLMFGAHSGLGLILLPIMIYHPLQLVVCGAIAGRWAKEADAAAPPVAEPVPDERAG
ncbi:MAG TPA: bile acid:sodium symporter family protein, partial [Pirellulales bacterium]